MPPNTRRGCTNKPGPQEQDLLLIKRRDSCGRIQPQQSNDCFGSRFGLYAGPPAIVVKRGSPNVSNPRRATTGVLTSEGSFVEENVL